jgi:PadR family transcriptional regulator, regulatory protein AphA
MILEYAILGFLNYQALSGYDLKKMFDNSVRHFWPADQSQIYRTLTRLNQQGWVTVELIEQSEHPDRKVYHITEAGRAELHGWLITTTPVWEGRMAPLIQIFFGGQLTDEELLIKCRQMKVQFENMLSLYQDTVKLGEQYAQIANSEREVFCWMLTLESGFQFVQSQINWIESVIRRIEQKEMPPQTQK